MITITDTLSIDAGEIDERFVRAAGAAGQNPNRAATAVTLHFDIAKSSLSEDVKARLRVLAGRHVTADGVLVVDSRTFRSQTQNRKAARSRLVALIKRAAATPAPRTDTGPGSEAGETRLRSKHLRSAVKSNRRRIGARPRG